MTVCAALILAAEVLLTPLQSFYLELPCAGPRSAAGGVGVGQGY